MFNVIIAIIFQLSGAIDMLAGVILAIFTSDMGRMSGFVIAGVGLLLFSLGRLMLGKTRKKAEGSIPSYADHVYAQQPSQSSALFR